MDLLTNAIESIQIGVEDYQKNTRPRLLSSVRNIHAGILLLYKEALLRLSPENSKESLIKRKVIPKKTETGDIIYIGKGKNTVNIHQIKERFSSLGINTDWNKMNSITKVRNNIEHYYPSVNQDTLHVVISSAFNIIREFAFNQLNEEPRELLGQDIWNIMLNVSDVYENERKECNEALKSIDWNSDILENGVFLLNCNECGSDLLKPKYGTSYTDVVLECRSCGKEYDNRSFIPKAISEELSLEAYNSIKYGEEPPYSLCPECGSETYLFDEDRCALCGETAVTTCQRCGMEIPACEMSSSPYCSYCWHMMNKND
ncbi:hypothetical protein [Halanaerobium congolense]|jgi:hypothetical protein|uniref:hypothetical protein n=1 Tax=Halanaerobium congolense TaxID=54121 RepID=UPI000794FD9C|nr:hypothetical protein [Halanaerobium congolense]KXS38258.1 MAG: hypothetical protein AWU54_2227 [Candidatus Frackibacter sp. T328-2]TDP07458.1 DNA-directed RNA polymerase subunit M/transcription elongation factor TFIIS [Halanaerobium congolense]